jgi:hypothetical protein
MNKWLFYLSLLIGPAMMGIYWGTISNGPTHESIFILVLYCILMNVLRRRHVKVPLIDFSLNPKTKWERFKKIWTAP